MSEPGPKKARRASFLSPPDFHRLDFACHPIYAAYGSPPYLVGSVLTSPDFRDVDLRLILGDEEFNGMVPDGEIGLLLNIAYSGLIANAANLKYPIDFQIQQMTAANEEFGRQRRNPMGMRLQWRTKKRAMRAEAATRIKRLDPVAAPPPSPGARGKTFQEKVEHAIAIRESTAKARDGKPLAFPTGQTPGWGPVSK